jgi:hypothetical protein
MGFQFNPFTGNFDSVGTGGGGGNPFDQSLNTTDDVTFNSATATEGFVAPVFFAGDAATGAQLRADATLLLRPSVKENWEVLRGVVGYDSATNNLWYRKSTTGLTKRIVDEDYLTWANILQKPSVADVTASNNFTSGQSITAPANNSALTASYSVTGANTTPLLDLSGTWNTTGIARGILLNVTDTASAASSRLLDVQSSGTSAFSVNKFGQFTGSGGFSFTPAANTGTFSFVSGSTGSVQFNSSSGNIFVARADAIKTFNFAGAFAVGWNSDTYLYRDAANTLALRNGTNAQAFRLYNTFTDASNYERGFMRWNSNVLEIGTEAGGTGTGNRAFRIFAGSTSGIDFTSSGASGATNISGVRSISCTSGLVLANNNSSTISGLTLTNYTSGAADPTTSTITNGNWQVHRNTTTGVVKLWANNAGSLVSVGLS